jgi:hypothetical protein
MVTPPAGSEVAGHPDPSNSATAETRVLRGDQLRRNSRFVEALAEYNGALLEDPQNKAATAARDATLAQMKTLAASNVKSAQVAAARDEYCDWVSAAGLLRQAIDLDPENADAKKLQQSVQAELSVRAAKYRQAKMPLPLCSGGEAR